MKLQFGDSIHIEVPRNWTYLDSNLKNHISTGRDAVLRLAGFGPESGTKVILLAGNAYTKHRTASATLRLSVQWAKTPIQAEMRETLKFSKKEQAEALGPIAEDARRLMVGVDGVKSAKVTEKQVVITDKNVICTSFMIEADLADGASIHQTYACPFGDHSVLLSTSYRKSEAFLFRPVLEIVWRSLAVVGP